MVKGSKKLSPNHQEYSVDDILDGVKEKQIDSQSSIGKNKMKLDDMLNQILAEKAETHHPTRDAAETLLGDERSHIKETNFIETQGLPQNEGLPATGEENNPSALLEKEELPSYKRPPTILRGSEKNGVKVVQPSTNTEKKVVRFEDAFPTSSIKTSQKPSKLNLEELIAIKSPLKAEELNAKKETSFQQKESEQNSSKNSYEAKAEQELETPLTTKNKKIPFKNPFNQLEETLSPVEESMYKKEYTKFKEKRQGKVNAFILTHKSEDPEKAKKSQKPEIEEDDYNSFSETKESYNDIVALSQSLSIRMVTLLVLALFTTYLTLGNLIEAIPLPSIFNVAVEPLPYIIINLIFLVIAFFAGLSTITNGVTGIVNLQPNRDTMPSLITIVALVINIAFVAKPEAMAYAGVGLYTPLAIIGLLFNFIGQKLVVKRTFLNFKVVSSQNDKYATTLVANDAVAIELARDLGDDLPILVANQKVNFVTGFFAQSYAPDASDFSSKLIVPIAVCFATLLAGMSYFELRNTYLAATTFLLTMCFCSPLAYGLIVNLPLIQVAKKLTKKGGAILSSDGCEEISLTNCTIVNASELFPTASVEVLGIKTFSGMRIDEAIIDATSVLVEAKSILSEVFLQVIGNKKELLRPIDSLIYEDNMGISSWVIDKRVLIGNRELMLNHQIDIPAKDFEKKYDEAGNSLVYLAVSGELNAVFIVNLKANQGVLAGLNKLCSNKVTISVRSVDCMITQEKLAEVFLKDAKTFHVIAAKNHQIYRDLIKTQERKSSSILNTGSFYSFATSIVSTKRLKSSILVGLAMQVASILLGVGIVATYTIMSSIGEIHFALVLFYQLLWLVLLPLILFFKRK